MTIGLMLAFFTCVTRGWAEAGSWNPVRIYKVDYVLVDELASRYNLKLSWLEKNKRVRLQSQWTTMEIEADDREISWNGLRLFLSEEVVPVRKTLGLSLVDVESTLLPLLQPGKLSIPPRPRLIAIDAGHGGNDTGTGNRQLKLNEKTFTLDVAQRLQQALEKLGYQTMLTRSADKYVGLEQRPALAKSAGADLFVSIHFNALANNARVHGIETYSYTPAGQRSTTAHVRRKSDQKVQPGNRFDHWNTLLSSTVHRQMIEELGATDRGMKRARFAVLQTAACPAILVEAGFLSNKNEAQKIASAVYREQIAQAIAGGVQKYIDLLEINAARSVP